MTKLLEVTWRLIQRNSTGYSFNEPQFVPERELEMARIRSLFYLRYFK